MFVSMNLILNGIDFKDHKLFRVFFPSIQRVFVRHRSMVLISKILVRPNLSYEHLIVSVFRVFLLCWTTDNLDLEGSLSGILNIRGCWFESYLLAWAVGSWVREL